MFDRARHALILWATASCQRLYRSPGYWRFRTLRSKLQFRRARFFYGIGIRRKHLAESGTALNQLFRQVLPSAFFALLTTILVYSLRLVPTEAIFGRLRARYGFVESVLSHLESVTVTLSPPTYDTFLTTVAAVSGVFLALYFTALATVAGRVYAQTAGPIRNLIIRDRFGNTYVGILSFLTSLSILLLVPRTFGYGVSLAGLVLVALLTVPAVFSFAILSKYTFRFFDPSELVPNIMKEILDAAKASTPKVNRWNDPSFQSHNQRSAASATGQLRYLVDYCSREEHLRARPLTGAIDFMMRSVTYYLNLKSSIPTESHWFARVPKYQSIYLASSPAVEMSDATGTMINPELAPDPNWVERELLSLSARGVRQQLSCGLLPNGYEASERAMHTLQAISGRWDVGAAIAMADDWFALLRDYSKMDPPEVGATSLDNRDLLAFSEVVSRIPIGMLLGFYNALQALPRNVLDVKLDHLRWTTERALYRIDLPSPLLEQAEHLVKMAQFELAAEKRVVSPKWYMLEIMHLRAAKTIAEGVQVTVDLASSFYVATARQLLSESKHEQAAVVLANARQFLSKLNPRFLRDMQNCYDGYVSDPVNDDLPWPAPDWDAIRDSLCPAEFSIQELQAQLILNLFKIRRPSHMPDLFGTAVHQTGNAIMDSLLEGDETRFAKLFPMYLTGILAMHEKLGEELTGYRDDAKVVGSTDPVLDLVDLSGYAKLMAEFHGKPSLWNMCAKGWDDFLSADSERRLNWLNAILEYHRHWIGISTRSLLRTRWETAIMDKIRELPRQQLFHGDMPIDEEPIHNSPLVRIFGQGELVTSHNGIDVFADLYLLTREDRGDRQFGSRGDLASSLARRDQEQQGED